MRGPDRSRHRGSRRAARRARSTFGVDMDLHGVAGLARRGLAARSGDPGRHVVLGARRHGARRRAAQPARAARPARAGRGRARRRQLERDRSLVSGLAPVLQASLDLGEVLPSVSSHLREGHGARRAQPHRADRTRRAAAVRLRRATGRLGAADGHGRRSGSNPARRSRCRSPAAVACSVCCASSPERRCWRDDLLALSTAGELVGSTLANAEAFARQQDLVERMRSVDELKTVFLATASHELRTPVTAIVGFSALLLQHWDTMSGEQSRGLVERVHANSKRLEALTEQLLDFAQLERGLPRSDDRVIDLGRVVGQILADQPELASGHHVDTYLTPRCMIRGSRSALERIVTNLVGNAAKYAPPGTRISVTVQPRGRPRGAARRRRGAGRARRRPRTDLQPLLPRTRRLREPHPRGRCRPRHRRRVRRVACPAPPAVRSAPSGGARFSISFPAVGPPAARVRRSAQAAAGLEGTADVALS